MQFILILVLLDSLMFGAPAKPRLRKVAAPVTQAQPTPTPTDTPLVPCVDSGGGEVACYPIDDNDKHQW